MLKIRKIRNQYDCIKSARILVDPNLIVLLINKKAVDILETDKKNIIGSNILLYLPNEIRFILLPKIKKLLRGINSKHIKKSEKNSIETMKLVGLYVLSIYHFFLKTQIMV